MKAKPFAFVLMPFESQFDDIYKLGIQAVASEEGVVAERVDEQNFSETILERIYRQIQNADFIIADMTGRNANVFYEVGYAHARDKLCTLLTQSSEDIPFDLKQHRHIIYDGSIQKLKRSLRSEIKWLKGELDKREASTFTIMLKSSFGDLVSTEYSRMADVELVYHIRNNSDRKSPDIDAVYLYTGKGWTFSVNNEQCPSATAEDGTGRVQHFIKSPVPRLSPGGWAPIRLTGRKALWSKYEGKGEPKDTYTVAGHVTLELATAEGRFEERQHISIAVDELPF